MHGKEKGVSEGFVVASAVDRAVFWDGNSLVGTLSLIQFRLCPMSRVAPNLANDTLLAHLPDEK